MLWNWQNKVENYDNSGYDVLAISPTFNAVKGYNKYPWPPPAGPEVVDPYWGTGTGTLIVDYRATSTDFWHLVEQHRPIAIMSFSRGNPDKSWELEAFGTNWARDQDVPNLLPEQFWTTRLYYKDLNHVQQHEDWLKPYIGGSATDPSPLQNAGELKYKPPDATPTFPALSTRASNLPNAEIKAAIDNAFPAPPGNIVARIDNGGAGTFVSNFMAYHVAWYRHWWSTANTDPTKTCLFSGHTHVGVFVQATDAETAVDIQLKELIKKLP